MREHLRARYNGSGSNGNIASNNGNYQNGQGQQASSNNGKIVQFYVYLHAF
jgi:hypothetical protein